MGSHYLNHGPASLLSVPLILLAPFPLKSPLSTQPHPSFRQGKCTGYISRKSLDALTFKATIGVEGLLY